MGDPELEWLAMNGFEVLVEAEIARAAAHKPMVFGNLEFQIADEPGAKRALPKGTTRK